jgi:GDP-D-mannose dehydratase
MRAIISGICGQDGSYLADLLVEKGYDVWGLVRRSSIPRYDNIVQLLDNPKFHLVETDLLDPVSVRKIVGDVQANELYNLAAQSHVQTSFNQPTLTLQVNTVGVLNFLEAIKDCSKHTKFYQASTSEMWGQNYSIDAKGINIKMKILPLLLDHHTVFLSWQHIV